MYAYSLICKDKIPLYSTLFANLLVSVDVGIWVTSNCMEIGPGQFISLRNDKETRTFLFTGQSQKLQVPAKDFVALLLGAVIL